jgi:hypothetical protein
MKCNTAATLYSRTISGGSEVWTRSVIPAVLWEERKAANVIESGLLEADKANVYIPNTDTLIKVGDILAKGEVDKNITSSYTISDLRKDYTTIKVTSVDVKDFGSEYLQHIQVGGS